MTTTQNYNDLIAFVPELDSPKAFDQWRLEVVRLPMEEQLLIAQYLKENHFQLGSLRAAMFLMHVDLQKSKQYSMYALQSPDRAVMLLAKAHLTNLIARESWFESVQASFDMRPSQMVLENILQELKNIVPATPIVLEAMTRLHLMLTDAYTLTQKFELAQLNAAEASILSSVLELETTSRVARYQLASIALLEAQPESALASAQNLVNDAKTDKNLAARATEILVLSLDAQGDHDGVEALIGEGETLSLKSHMFSTFRLPANFVDKNNLTGISKYQKLICETTNYIIAAQETPPDQTQVVQTNYKKAFEQMQAVGQVAMGWYKISAKTWGALFLRNSGDASLAMLQIPSLEEIAILPIGKRVPALYARIECLESGLPDSSQEMLETLTILTDVLGQCESRILKQLNKQAELFTPFALALVSKFPGVPEHVVVAGGRCIMNLQDSVVTVYESNGLRPAMALQYALENFGIFTEDKTRLGGGQLKGLRAALCRPYHHRIAWYQPVTALRVAFALLCCRDGVSNKSFAGLITKAVRDLRVHFGYEPKLQKTSIPKNFKELVKLIKKFEQHELSVEAVAVAIDKLGGGNMD